MVDGVNLDIGDEAATEGKRPYKINVLDRAVAILEAFTTALGISVPQFRFTEELRAQLAPSVKEAADKVSRALTGQVR